MPIFRKHIEDLRDVIQVLENMREALDDTRHPCDSCGRDSWDNLQEGRLANEVDTMLRKGNKSLALVHQYLNNGKNIQRIGRCIS